VGIDMNLVYIRYKDHVLFQKSEFNLYSPVVREAVGWLVKENDEAVWIIWDRSVKSFPNEGIEAESGLVVLKDNVIEMRKIVGAYP